MAVQVRRDLEDITTSLGKKHGWHEDVAMADDYVILMEVFKFFLGKRKSLARHFSVHDLDDEEQECDEKHEEEALSCDVCGDEAYYEYCGSNVCGKCRHFFVTTMRNRTRLSLRCSGTKGE